MEIKSGLVRKAELLKIKPVAHCVACKCSRSPCSCIAYLLATVCSRVMEVHWRIIGVRVEVDVCFCNPTFAGWVSALISPEAPSTTAMRDKAGGLNNTHAQAYLQVLSQMYLSSHWLIVVVEHKGAARILMSCLIQQVCVCMHITWWRRGAETEAMCCCWCTTDMYWILPQASVSEASKSEHKHVAHWQPQTQKNHNLFHNVTFKYSLTFQHMFSFPKTNPLPVLLSFIHFSQFHPQKSEISGFTLEKQTFLKCPKITIFFSKNIPTLLDLLIPLSQIFIKGLD